MPKTQSTNETVVTCVAIVSSSRCPVVGHVVAVEEEATVVAAAETTVVEEEDLAIEMAEGIIFMLYYSFIMNGYCTSPCIL
jgi:hypothetical protein